MKISMIKYNFILLSIISSCNFLFAQKITGEFKNDTIHCTYMIKHKSKNHIVIQVSKRNLLARDSLLTYGYISNGKRVKKKTIYEFNSMKVDSIFDWMIYESHLIEKGIYIDNTKLISHFIFLAPQETYTYTLILKDKNEIAKFYLLDRYKVIKNIKVYKNSKVINLTETKFDITTNSDAIKIFVPSCE